MIGVFAVIAIITAAVLLFIASVEDLKTREVPDYVSYFLMGSGIFIRALWFLFEKDTAIIFWMPTALLVLGGFSYMLYKSGQWGGGDVKIMAGIALLLSSFPGETIPFFFNFLINSLIVGAIYGSIGIAFTVIKNRKKVQYKWYEINLLPISFISSIVLIYYTPLFTAFFGIFILVSILSLIFFKRVEEVGMQKDVPVKHLTEGDWLVDDVKLNNKVFLKKRNIGLTLKDIEKLKKKKEIKKVKIKTGIPFVPVFLITLFVTLLFGNVLVRIVLSSI